MVFSLRGWLLSLLLLTSAVHADVRFDPPVEYSPIRLRQELKDLTPSEARTSVQRQLAEVKAEVKARRSQVPTLEEQQKQQVLEQWLADHPAAAPPAPNRSSATIKLEPQTPTSSISWGTIVPTVLIAGGALLMLRRRLGS